MRVRGEDRNGYRRAFQAALLAAAALLIFSAAVGAHSEPIRMEPGAGGVVFLPYGGGAVSGTITARIWLSERADRGFTVIEVYDPAGERVDVPGSLAFESQGAIVSLKIAPKRLGEHTIRYRILSAVDGHLAQGSVSFVAAAATPGPGAEPSAPPAALAFRLPRELGARTITVTVLRNGERIFSGQASFAPAGEVDAAEIELSDGAPGTYEVRWELATAAGPKFGVYSFSVGGS